MCIESMTACASTTSQPRVRHPSSVFTLLIPPRGRCGERGAQARQPRVAVDELHALRRGPRGGSRLGGVPGRTWLVGTLGDLPEVDED